MGETFLVVMAVMLLGAIVWGSIGVRRSAVISRARTPLETGDGTSTLQAAEVVWDARELSESPHARALARSRVSTPEEAVLHVQQTLASLPPGQATESQHNRELLAASRQMRSASTVSLATARGPRSARLAEAVAEGLVAGMATTTLPARHPHVRAAIEDRPTDPKPLLTVPPGISAAGGEQLMEYVRTHFPHTMSAGARLVDASFSTSTTHATTSAGQLFGGLGRALRMDFSSSSTTKRLAWNFEVTDRMGTSGRELLERMAWLGIELTPAYLSQLSAASSAGLHHVTSMLTQFEREVEPTGPLERLRRRYWPSAGDIIVADALHHGRRVLVNEHEAHQRLTQAVRELEDADARVRGTAWALMLDQVPRGALEGPDLTRYAGEVEQYLADRKSR